MHSESSVIFPDILALDLKIRVKFGRAVGINKSISEGHYGGGSLAKVIAVCGNGEKR